MKDDLILVTGAGGFIGGHLVANLRQQGYKKIRAVDIKPLTDWFQRFDDVENLRLDLKLVENCREVVKGACQVFNLAADMGGIGFIEGHRTECMLSVLINTHMLLAAADEKVERYFYSSSACVYNLNKQTDPNNPGLKEWDAYPALPEDGYGWEKLFSERMCHHFRRDYDLQTKVARLHNVYGPYGAWIGGREKAPAAICRKVAEAKLQGKNWIKIWGNGRQTRSFTYIDDCLKGIQLIMLSDDILDPINLGSNEMVSINQLVSMVEDIAGVKLVKTYQLSAPKGVTGRNSDNTLIKDYLNWEPSTPLRVGLEKTYAWIYDQVRRSQ